MATLAQLDNKSVCLEFFSDSWYVQISCIIYKNIINKQTKINSWWLQCGGPNLTSKSDGVQLGWRESLVHFGPVQFKARLFLWTSKASRADQRSPLRTVDHVLLKRQQKYDTHTHTRSPIHRLYIVCCLLSLAFTHWSTVQRDKKKKKI